jgi:IclR family transcriptional regulator, KDG regulon repressor
MTPQRIRMFVRKSSKMLFMSENTTSKAVERALSIIELVAESKKGLSNSDLSRRLKIPKSSASYILRVLENRAYLQRDKSGRYHLGLKLMSLTGDALTHLDIRETARPILEDFVRGSRLPEAHLAVLDNGRAVYIEKVESASSFIKMDIWVGHRLPVHTTAIGKILVSDFDKTEIVKILELRGMEKKTRQTITSKNKFLKEIEKVRAEGYAIDNEENSEGVRCIAAPIYDAGGKLVAALGTSSTILHIDDAQIPHIAELIKKAAAELSMQLGYQ